MLYKHKRMISYINENPFVNLVQLGYKPAEIKEFAIDTLKPYFENHSVLEKFAINSLVPECINLMTVQEDSWFFGKFKEVLGSYNLAKHKDSLKCFESCASWQPHINDSVSKFWSILYLERDKTKLEIDEFLKESLTNIGDIIEGLTKPYLKSLLNQLVIANGAKRSFEDIDALDLGAIVNELIQRSNYGDLFMPPPWNVKLNQWRNIAYHHNARIENKMIVCWYRESSKLKNFRLSRDEFLHVTNTIARVFKVLRLSHVLFVIDNLEEIKKLSLSVNVREDAEFLPFAAGLVSQGFLVIDYLRNPEEVKLVVKDMSDLDPSERRFHASQFLFFLWNICHAKIVTIEYREKDGTPNLLVSTDSKTCEEILNGEMDPLDLAKVQTMVDLKSSKPRL